MIASQDHSMWAEVDPKKVEAMREMIDIAAAALPDSEEFDGGGPKHQISVGANAGMRLDDDGGIAVYIAAEKPEGVPEENWLPINREDVEIGPIMRLYAPDLERFKSWTAPKAEELTRSRG